MNTGALIGYKTISDIGSRLCSFAVALLAARTLSTVEFGLFALAWATGWILAVAGDFGLQLFLARETARQPGRAGAVFKSLLRIRAALAALFAAALATGSLLLLDLGAAVGFFLVGSAQILSSLIDFYNHLYRGVSRSDVESTVNLAHRGAGLLLTAALLSAFADLTALGIGLAAASAGALLASRSTARSLLRSLNAGSDAAGSWKVSWKSFTTEALPIGLGVVLSALYFRVDLFFLEWLRGTESVAYYGAVFRIFDALRLFPAAVLAVIFPQLCRPSGSTTLLRSGTGLFLLALAAAAATAWQADRLVRLFFGTPYAAAVPAFRILLAALPALFVNFLLTHQLIAWNLQSWYLLLCGLGLFASAGLNAWLTSSYGMEGAAWACAVREGLLTAGCALILWRKAPQASTRLAAETAR